MGLKHNLENLLDQKGKVESYQCVGLDKSHPFPAFPVLSAWSDR